MSVYIGWKQRVLVFSVKLSNANPVSTWIGERLTLLGVVDFSCSADAFSYPMTCLGYVFAVNVKII